MRAPPFLPHRHLEEIGNLATYWGWFQITMDATIWALLGVSHHPGAAITTHVGIMTKIDTVKILAAQGFQKQPLRLQQLNNLIERVEGVRVKRNDYIHHWWFHSPGSKKPKGWKISARSNRGELKITETAVPIGEIEQATYEVWQLTLDWMCFLQATFPRYSFPWPKISAATARTRNRELRNPPTPPNRRKRVQSQEIPRE